MANVVLQSTQALGYQLVHVLVHAVATQSQLECHVPFPADNACIELLDKYCIKGIVVTGVLVQI